MPLHPSETAQCDLCEEYSRLSELDDVLIVNGEVGVDQNDVIGYCPYCQNAIERSHIG